MARMGFIHDELDIKLLALYLLDKLAGPIDFPTLTDLAMCDPGVDYFSFATAISELTASNHISVSEGVYSITEKGRRNIADGASTLSLIIRQRCDQQLRPVNAELRRRAQVRTSVTKNGDESYTLTLIMDDDIGNLMNLSLSVVSEEQCTAIASRYRAHPDQVYHGILRALLPQEKNDEPNP